MNKKIARIMCFILLFAVVASFALSFTASASGGADSDGDGVYYCREALKKLPNAESLLYVYDAIVAGIDACLTDISVRDSEHSVTPEEFDVVYDAYIRDHAEHFWLGKSYSFSATSEEVYTLHPSYTLSGQELDSAKLSFNEAVNAFLSVIDDSMTEYEKELALHDSLAARVVYEESEHAHDSYGALVEGVAVCEGYAEALQCLLHAAGIRSLIAIGSSINPHTQLPEGHAWNIVRIDGKYYHTDLTWNDQASTLFHAYFNLSDDKIKEDHELNETVFDLPVCDSLEENYFINEGLYIEEYSISSVAQMLVDEGMLINIYISEDVDEFVSWFDLNIRDIASYMGLVGSFSYGRFMLGNEVVIKIDACLHESLTFVPQSEADCLNAGNVAHYVCECGRYFYDSAATQAVYSPEILFFNALGHNFAESEENESTLRSASDSCLLPYTYWHSCTRCGILSNTDYSESEMRGPHTPGDPPTTHNPQTCIACGEVLAPSTHTHVTVMVEEKPATCRQDGKKAYYTCECGKNFIDEAATKEIINIDNYGKLDSLGHGTVGSDGKCPRCGTLLKFPIVYIVSGVAGLVLFFLLIKLFSMIVEKIRG